MALTLRPYQREAVDAVYRHLRERDDNPCVVIPTAGGKTPCMATICRDAISLWSGRVLILAHVKELLQQAVDKLNAVAPDLWRKTGVYSAGLRSRDTDHPIIVAGIQSVYKRACELDRFDLVCIDEAHMIPPEGDGMYRTFLAEARKVNPALRVIGLTATPFRMKSGSICSPEGFLNHVCYEIGVRELIVQGYLSPLVTKAGRRKADTSSLHVRAGEFAASETEALMDTDDLVDSACAEIVQYTHDRKSVLVFASGIKHAEHVARVLREKHGADASTVFGDTLPSLRDEVLTDFKAGRLEYLVNVNVLTTGFDAPNIDCVALVRPTNSPGLYYQMCLDMETEVLTSHGWARCDEARKGDTVAAFDLATEQIVWCRAEDKVHRRLAPGESMYGVQAPHLDIRVTNLHSMIYRSRSRSTKHWQIAPAEKLALRKDCYCVPIAGANDGPGLPLTDDEIRFLGWEITDGHFDPRNCTVTISQSAASPHNAAIRSMLEGCGFGYRVYRIKRKGELAQYPDGLVYVVPKGQPRGINKKLRGYGDLFRYLTTPLLEKFKDISRRQLRIFLEAMNLGDGSKPTTTAWKKKTWDLAIGNYRFLADQLQALLIQRGFRCNMRAYAYRTTWHTRAPQTSYILHVREQRRATIGGTNSKGNSLISRRSMLKPVPFSPAEWVWCLTTSHGTLVTRRNGKVAILGNCGRGFRLHPGKADCLVLDYGGNVLRHGPVDQIRVPDPASKGGEAPAKECPQCLALVAAGYATCPQCGFAFPERDRARHDAKASTAGVLSGQVTVTEYEVLDTTYSVHRKAGAPPDAPRTMRVDYAIDLTDFRSEWICFEHAGYARHKAEIWWRERSEAPVPDTAEEAVRLAGAGALAETLSITVRSVSGEKYDRIVGHKLGEKPSWREPGWDEEAPVEEPVAMDLEDVPF